MASDSPSSASTRRLVGVERGQGAAEVASGERREVERPRLVGGPAGVPHAPAFVGPAVAVADDDEAADRPRRGGEGRSAVVGNRRPEGGHPAQRSTRRREIILASRRAGARPPAEEIAAGDRHQQILDRVVGRGSPPAARRAPAPPRRAARRGRSASVQHVAVARAAARRELPREVDAVGERDALSAGQDQRALASTGRPLSSERQRPMAS